mgnify:CR=1 FL=1
MLFRSFDPINVGVDEDDVTGDLNRDAWIKVNSNFAAVDAQIADLAPQTELDALETALDSAIDTINDALALKQDAADPLDPGDGVAHFDGAQTITGTERRQLAINTGGFVTLTYDLVASSTTIAGTNTYKLPIFPETFRVHSAYLSLVERTVGSGGTLLVGFTLDQSAVNIATNTGTHIPASGKIGSTISGTPQLVSGNATSVTVTVTDTETGSPVRKGLRLWVRGIWEA